MSIPSLFVVWDVCESTVAFGFLYKNLQEHFKKSKYLLSGFVGHFSYYLSGLKVEQHNIYFRETMPGFSIKWQILDLWHNVAHP